MLYQYLQILSLHRLSLCETRLLLLDGTSGRPAHNIAMDIIEPLLSLDNLTTIVILTDGLVLDREATHAISLSIPRLKVLELLALSDDSLDRPRDYADSHPASLDSLEPLARWSTNLELLSIAIDCGSVPPIPEEWASQSRVFHGDIRLYNHNGDLWLPGVYAYISTLFPQFDIEANRYYHCRDSTSFDWM